ncbi:MAG: glutamate--tRNA ligase [Spirochaetes bacterium]|nr:MAG: glutamate--tRNA ligase [Spirochaetota bacterium]
MDVRVRYAPSPTGLQHIGGVRTALFNYFFARSMGGKFILRVEDTDRERFSEESLKDLYDTLEWLGIDWDEGPVKGGAYGPYIQSERTELYTKYANQLVEDGKAYHCYCSSERLDKVREVQKKEKKNYGYDRHCRDLSIEERDKNEKDGLKSVIRLKIPLEGKTSFDDLLLGTVTRKNKDISPDPVLLKSDGFPTYHLANVVDDHLMEITHILRAQEWIPSGAMHILLYKAFGWEPPLYCHLPMVMGKDGQKLSKRHGSTSVVDFRKRGYLPEAIINYVTMVGWAYDDSREFFTKEELEKLFSLEKISKSPGVFDYKKLEWFNGQYIRKKSEADLIEEVIPYLKKDGIISEPITEKEMLIIKNMMSLMTERLHFISDISELASFLFKDIGNYTLTDIIPKKMDFKGTILALEGARELVEGFESRTDEENEELFRKKAEEVKVKLGSMLMPLRVAISGSKVSPPIFGSLRLLGVDKALERIDHVIGLLKEAVKNENDKEVESGQ